MKRYTTRTVAFTLLSAMVLVPVCEAADVKNKEEQLVPPAIFQAAGVDAVSIQSTVDAYRAALGEPNNLNEPGPLSDGRREINWDGGGNVDITTPPETPFEVFLNTRGGKFTTPGLGLSQAPPAGGPQGGLATLFNNQTYGDIFTAFSPLRLFTPVGSNVTDALFFVPGSNGAYRATVRGFGAVFTDVDQPDGLPRIKKYESPLPTNTLIEYYDEHDKLIFSSFVPASPGDGSLSFFGIVFEDALIARVRITTGTEAPGPDDDGTRDIVMMDDFIYGEPQQLQ
jgi:hypothetical protein